MLKKMDEKHLLRLNLKTQGWQNDRHDMSKLNAKIQYFSAFKYDCKYILYICKTLIIISGISFTTAETGKYVMRLFSKSFLFFK